MGAEFARVALRGIVGATMIAHGVRHARSIDGTARWFNSIGFSRPRLQAQASAVVEVGAGTALVLGAGTPLAASAVVGTMAVAARSVHVPNGFFITAEGYEYVLNLGAAAVAISGLGAGAWSIDRLVFRRGAEGGLRSAALTAGLGLAAAGAQLAAFWRKPGQAA